MFLLVVSFFFTMMQLSIHYNTISIQNCLLKWCTGALKLHRKHFKMISETVKKYDIFYEYSLICVVWCELMWLCQCWYVSEPRKKIKKIAHCTGVQRVARKEIFSYQILLSHILFASFFSSFSSLVLSATSLILPSLFLWHLFSHFLFSSNEEERKDREWAIASHQML